MGFNFESASKIFDELVCGYPKEIANNTLEIFNVDLEALQYRCTGKQKGKRN